MITSNHDLYLKNELEPDDGYPHQELYEWSDMYIWSYQFNSHQFNTNTDVQPPFAWKNRYNTLKHGTKFFKNICLLDDIIWKSVSIESFKILRDTSLLPIEASNFIICYIWMCPGKWFSYDWKSCILADTDAMLYELNHWEIIDHVHNEIVINCLPMLEFDEFLELNA